MRCTDFSVKIADFKAFKRTEKRQVRVSAARKQRAMLFSSIEKQAKRSLSHKECIQTLGMKLVHACIEASIPYAITVHDGWWRCARQFLVYEKGEYCGD